MSPAPCDPAQASCAAHGNPIPDRDLALPPETTPALTALQEEEAAVLLSVHPETTATLAYLAAHDFRPGRRFRVEHIEATDRLYLLRHETGMITVGPELAARLYVRREPEPKAARSLRDAP
jgi:hypothetical protein